MTVYLIHFEKPIAPGKHTTQHYLGYAADLAARIQQHQSGGSHAARLIQVARERSVDWRVVRTWPDGDRALERRLKGQKNSPRLCPICAGEGKQITSALTAVFTMGFPPALAGLEQRFQAGELPIPINGLGLLGLGLVALAMLLAIRELVRAIRRGE